MLVIEVMFVCSKTTGIRAIVGIHPMTSRRNQNVGLVVIFLAGILVGAMSLVYIAAGDIGQVASEV